MEQKQKQKTSYNNSNSDFDNNLTITHDVIAPSIDDILASVRAALESAQQTIDAQGGACGCF